MQMQDKDRQEMSELGGGHNGASAARPPGVGDEVIGEELLASQGGDKGYVSLG